MTTVGYGDISPETGGGKAAAIVLMLAGITVFGAITANLAAWFTRSREEADQADLGRRVQELTAAVERLTAQVGKNGSSERPLQQRSGSGEPVEGESHDGRASGE